MTGVRIQLKRWAAGATAALLTALMRVVLCAVPSWADSHVTVPVKVSFDGINLPEETFTVQMIDETSGRKTTGDVTLSAGKKSGVIELDLGELAGTRVFELKQLAGSRADVVYDDTVYRYYVEVGEDGSVRCTAVNKADPSDKPAQVAFNNSYRHGAGNDEVTGDPPVRVRKNVSGREPPKAERFVFIMRPDDPSYPLPDVASAGSGVIKDGVAEVYLDGEGEIEIGNITFRAEGIYRYTVSEKDTAVEGYAYDDARFTVVYEVTRNQDGKLACTRTITKANEGVVTACEFDNTYDPNPIRRTIRRGIKTGDPVVMWPITALCAAAMVIAACISDKRNRRKAGRER